MDGLAAKLETETRDSTVRKIDSSNKSFALGLRKKSSGTRREGRGAEAAELAESGSNSAGATTRSCACRGSDTTRKTNNFSLLPTLPRVGCDVFRWW